MVLCRCLQCIMLHRLHHLWNLWVNQSSWASYLEFLLLAFTTFYVTGDWIFQFLDMSGTSVPALQCSLFWQICRCYSKTQQFQEPTTNGEQTMVHWDWLSFLFSLWDSFLHWMDDREMEWESLWMQSTVWRTLTWLSSTLLLLCSTLVFSIDDSVVCGSVLVPNAVSSTESKVDTCVT